MGRERDKNGRFMKGNEIGMETRIKKGEVLRTTYDDSYPDDILRYFREYNGYPTLEGWCDDRGVAYTTALGWSKNEELCPLFVDAYAQCKSIQRRKGIDGGISGAFNPMFTKFVLSSLHGMREKDNNVTISVKVADDVDEDSY